MVLGNERGWLIGAATVLFVLFLFARFNRKKVGLLWERMGTSGKTGLIIFGLSLMLLPRLLWHMSMVGFLTGTIIVSLMVFIWWLNDRRKPKE